jgi:hypothetical protein
MSNIYDVKIYFPDENGNAETGSYMTVRADGFEIPKVGVENYNVAYHGVAVARPKTNQQYERKFSMSFRLDAGFDLMRRFTAWHMMVVDPVTGGVSNTAQFLGKVEVETIVGAFFATTYAAELLGPDSTDPLALGAIKSGSDNPLAKWIFYDTWPSSVDQPKFKTEGAEALKTSVEFFFGDVDYPYYGANSLILS